MASPSWKLDFDSISVLNSKASLDPPGFSPGIAKDLIASTSSSSRRKDPELLAKKQKALMSRATGSAKQVAFMCFMMYMMGNGIQIFSIIMTITGLTGPITAILKSGEAFPPDPEKKLDTFTPRLVYCLIHLGQLVFVVQKLNTMGLLPTHPSDWLSATAAPQSVEHSYGVAL